MKQKTYKLVNILVLLLTVLLLSRALLHRDFSFVLHSPLIFLIMLGTAVLVHAIKAFRLYLELLDRKLPFGLFLRQYCKITPVSMILPLKAGDLFRCYCYGYYIGDWMYGIAVILLDRFVDTAALITVLILFVLPLGNAMPAVSFVYLFCASGALPILESLSDCGERQQAEAVCIDCFSAFAGSIPRHTPGGTGKVFTQLYAVGGCLAH